MSLGASTATPVGMGHPSALDVSKGADELLAGEISRIHAVMSGTGSDANRVNMAYAHANPSSHSHYKGSSNQNNPNQSSLSGPIEVMPPKAPMQDHVQ